MREKNLTVAKVPQGKEYVPGIRVAGKYLNEFNYQYGDKVKLTVSENKIVISRI